MELFFGACFVSASQGEARENQQQGQSHILNIWPRHLHAGHLKSHASVLLHIGEPSCSSKVVCSSMPFLFSQGSIGAVGAPGGVQSVAKALQPPARWVWLWPWLATGQRSGPTAYVAKPRLCFCCAVWRPSREGDGCLQAVPRAIPRQGGGPASMACADTSPAFGLQFDVLPQLPSGCSSVAWWCCSQAMTVKGGWWGDFGTCQGDSEAQPFISYRAPISSKWIVLDSGGGAPNVNVCVYVQLVPGISSAGQREQKQQWRTHCMVQTYLLLSALGRGLQGPHLLVSLISPILTGNFHSQIH